MTERDIKDYDPSFKKCISTHLQNLQILQHQDDPKSLRLLELDVSLRLLRSTFLEKRIKGLNELKEAIEEAAKYRSFFWSQKSQVLDTTQIVDWMTANRVIEVLTGDNTHAELLKRAAEVFELMAVKKKLTQGHLQNLWRSLGNKHESYVRAVYDLVSRMPLWMTLPDTQFLYQLISEQPPEQDEKYFTLVKNFSVAAIEAEGKWREQSDYGADMLFSLKDSNEQALHSLIGLLKECRQPSKRQLYIEKSLKRVMEEVAVPQNLYLALALLDSMQNYEQTEFISYLNKRNSLTSALTSSINGYIEVIRQMKITEDCVTTDATTHSKNLSLRFQMLNMVVKKGGKIDFASLEVLWSALVFNPVLPSDSKELFSWLISVLDAGKGLPYDDCCSLIAFFGNPHTFSISQATNEAFDAFFRLFLIVNKSQGLEIRGKTIVRRTEVSLVGLDIALSFVLDSQSDAVSESATSLVIECSVLLSSHASKAEIWANLASEILAVLSEIDSRRVTRALRLCHALIDLQTATPSCPESKSQKLTLHLSLPARSEKLTVPSDVPFGYVRRKVAEMLRTHPSRQYSSLSKIRLRWARIYTEEEDELPVLKVMSYSNSLEVEVMRNLVDEIKPSELLAVDGLYDALFRLATHRESAQLAWDLLLKLPLSRALKRSLERLETAALESPTRQTFHKCLYSLNIISELCQNAEYADRFLANEHGPQLIKGVFEMDIGTLGCSGLMVVKFTEVVFALIRRMVRKRLRLFDPSSILTQSISLLYFVAVSMEKGSEKAIAEVRRLFEECWADIDAPTLATVLSSHPKLKEILLATLLQCELAEIRTEMASFVLHLSRPPYEMSRVFLKILLELLLFALHEKHSRAFFEVVSKLVKFCGDNFADVLEESRKLLLDSLTGHGKSGLDAAEEALIGALQLLHSIGKTLSIQSTTSELEFVIQNCLLDMKPICETKEGRKAAYKLLLGMVVRSPGADELLLPHFGRLYEDPRWRTGRLAAWEITSETGERSQSGFVGLQNTGCICYMISALQQLFMIRSFRSQLLGLELSSHEDKEGSLVYICQRIFAGLKYSKKQSIGIKRLCKALEDSTVVNVNEQMDVEEFLNALMDQLEGKLGPNKAIISSHFAGQLVTETIGKGTCGHASERVEAFLTLPVEVKDKKSLAESLESLVSGETMEGDNAYQCDFCNAKVTAQRRVGLRHLPNVLFVALRRFDYNLDTMRRRKLNDYYEFPWELDLEPYTIEGLHRRDAATREDDCIVSSLSPPCFPETYYRYRLRGIVIHMGSAEGGHYYSFIQDRTTGKWFEFNDTVVREVDQSDIPAEAFGGEEKFKVPSFYGDVTEVTEKVSSAYLLLYERSVAYAPRSESEKECVEITLSADVPEAETVRPIIDKINEKNETFWRRKNAFAPEFILFIVKLAKVQIGKFPVFKLAVSVFVTVICRSRDRNAIQTLFPDLLKTLKSNGEAGKWLVELMTVPEVTHELFLACPHSFLRRLFATLVKAAAPPLTPEKRLQGAQRVLSLLLEAKTSQNYTQYFELLYTLTQNCVVPKLSDSLIGFVCGKSIQTPACEPCESQDAYLGYRNFEASPEHLRVAPPSRHPSISYLLATLAEQPLTVDQKREVLSMDFFKECLHKLEGKTGARMAGKLYSTLCRNEPAAGKHTIMMLLAVVNEGVESRMKLCLRILGVVLSIEDNHSTERTALTLSELSSRMKESSQTREKTKAELIGLFIYRQMLINVSVRQWVLTNFRFFAWVEEWTRRWTYSGSFNAETMDPSNAKRIKTLAMGRVMVVEDEWNSDDDIEFRPSTRLHILNPFKYSWDYATVLECFGDVARVKSDRDSPPIWIESDSEDIRPFRYVPALGAVRGRD